RRARLRARPGHVRVVTVRATLLLAALVTLSPRAHAAEPAGTFDFHLFASTTEGAECAGKPEVEQYLERQLIPAFNAEWSKRGQALDGQEFMIDFQFELEPDGKVNHSAIRTSTLKEAGEAVHDSFRAASPPPIPEPASCLVGQTYGYRILHE